MDFSINVPRLEWLIGGSRIGGSYNRYYGSIGTDGTGGFYGKKIFNYTVWIEKSDEREFLKAAVYPGMKSFDNTDEDDIVTEIFEPEEESMPSVEAWIAEKAKEFFA